VLTLDKADSATIVSISTANESLDDLLAKEWLLTNARGGYASSSVIGCNTSGYHGLLIGSLAPPAERVMALANCIEMVIFNAGASRPCKSDNGRGENVFNLSTFEFQDKFAPRGFGLLRRFRQDTGVHFDYEFEKLELTKSVYLLRQSDTVAIQYDFKHLSGPAEFVIRPLVGLRDFHSHQKSYAPLMARPKDNGLIVRHDTPASCELFLSCPAADFEKDEQWWFNFVYRNDKQRGQNFTEDLWTPGFFRARLNAPAKILFWANLSTRYQPENSVGIDIDSICEDLRSHQNSVTTVASRTNDERLGTLCLAADQFIAKRQTNGKTGTTVLAGYPWFADWGRDTFIALPGLLLATARYEEAKSVLTTFAAAVDQGMIPNRFDDNDSTAHFNSVDASLWFVNAAFQYLNVTGDSKTFTQDLLPTIRWIIESYHNGTRFGIHADDDGLITAGDSQTQLTWMDAKYDGVAFTPRHGKPVEVNALWYNSLCLMAQFYKRCNMENAEHYKSMADRVAAAFGQLFWNEKCGYLNDCIPPRGKPDSTLRPNQIYPKDKHYKGTYAGSPQQRDEAYHQGAVWAYLIGPFIEAYLKVNDFSKKSKDNAAQFIEPLMQHLRRDRCLTSISEIFDGDPPHKPGGCFAQAWSVAELIRAYQLINR